MPKSGTSTFERAEFGTALREHCTSTLIVIEPARFKARLTQVTLSCLTLATGCGGPITQSLPQTSPTLTIQYR